MFHICADQVSDRLIILVLVNGNQEKADNEHYKVFPGFGSRG